MKYERDHKKVVTGLTLTSLSGAILLILVVLYPQNLFANRMLHGSFTVYSNAAIDEKITMVLDDALELVEHAEIYDPTYHYDIFLCSGTFYNELDNKLLGRVLARATDNNILLKVEVDLDKNRLVGPKNSRNLTTTIAHEMIHCLQAHRYGKLKFNPWNHPELWKLEGYPEYFSKRSKIKSEHYHLRDEIQRLIEFEEQPNNGWIEIEKGQYDPVVYFRGRLMVEYLMDVKRLTYDQILNKEIKANSVYHEMLVWALHQD